jgi:membrane-bound PQQ-dependent dehydrogenase (glucose/quinate/shikimate family)
VTRLRWPIALAIGLSIVAAVGMTSAPRDVAVDQWPFYGHDAGGMRHSPLTQITRANVSRLKVAWVYQTGDVSEGADGRQRSGFETTPIVVDGTLYLTTPFNRVIALDPETGARRWAFDPRVDLRGEYGDGLINRGLATWLDASRRPGQPCRRRLYEATLDARLVALDAATGAACADFGERGEVSLRGVPGYRPGWYHMTSPPAVIDDLVVVGSSIDDNPRVDMPSGVVRAFDARSGALRWAWDPIPGTRDGARSSGAANAWSIMSADPDRHLVFVPTGSASPDHYGGLRPGDDKWANSVVALHAETGAVAWGFQLVHHDLWDYDSAAPPLLATIDRDGRPTPVVVQGNKTGFLYVLHRETGAPVFSVEERPVPTSDMPGEKASPTQPFPVAPPPLAPQRLTADQAWGVTPEDRADCREAIARLRNDGLFTPPSRQGSLLLPGLLGGMNWSGYAFEPTRHRLIVNTNNLAARVALIPREQFADQAGRSQDGSDYTAQSGSPYGMARRFLQGSSGLPCVPPPWGQLAAVNLSTGTIAWQVPLGSMENFGGAHGVIPPGAVSLGGPIVTAGGLIFIAGSVDSYLRAFDIDTGKELWAGRLPTGGHATPITYRVSRTGKQFVVIAAGGHAKVPEEQLGNALVAFALP